MRPSSSIRTRCPQMSVCHLCQQAVGSAGGVWTWPCGHAAHLACIAPNAPCACYCGEPWPQDGSERFCVLCAAAGITSGAATSITSPGWGDFSFLCCPHSGASLSEIPDSDRVMAYSELSSSWECVRCMREVGLLKAVRAHNRIVRNLGSEPKPHCWLHGFRRIEVDLRLGTLKWVCTGGHSKLCKWMAVALPYSVAMGPALQAPGGSLAASTSAWAPGVLAASGGAIAIDIDDDDSPTQVPESQLEVDESLREGDE